jgi:hypothetical protein
MQQYFDQDIDAIMIDGYQSNVSDALKPTVKQVIMDIENICLEANKKIDEQTDGKLANGVLKGYNYNEAKKDANIPTSEGFLNFGLFTSFNFTIGNNILYATMAFCGSIVSISGFYLRCCTFKMYSV